MNWGLEIAKLLYVTIVGVVLFLFFSLFLDVFCFAVGGGWQPLLGKWPVFGGTVSAAFYSPPGAVISLLLGFGIMARVILGDKTPAMLDFLDKRDRAVELVSVDASREDVNIDEEE